MSKKIHCLETVDNNKSGRIKYLLYFITRAFLLSMLILIVTIGSSVMLYLGDLLYNVKSGNFKSPIFGAYVIVSPSMVPTINVNDAIVVTRTNISNLEIGDVITFSSRDQAYSGLTVTHRIVGKQLLSDGEFVFRTKGDNNNVADAALVPNANVLGRVILKLPKLGYIQDLLASKGGLIFVVLIPSLVILSYDIMKIIKRVGQKTKLVKE